MRCIIVEDEYPARMELKFFIDEFKEIDVVGEFENSKDTLEFLRKNRVDKL
jgi:two-component system LytT family response regulator